MKRHDETLLWQYAARELDAETAALTEHHLSECVDCRERLLDVRQARLYVQDAQTPRPKVDWAKVDQGISKLVEARLLKQAKAARFNFRLPIAVACVAALVAVVSAAVRPAWVKPAEPSHLAAAAEVVPLETEGTHVVEARGLARVGAQLAQASEGDNVSAGEVLRTAVGGRAVLTLPDASRMRLLGGSQLALTRSEADDVALTLERGKVGVKASHRARKGFVVHSNGLTVRVVGTLFTVSQVAGVVEVVVAEGRVAIEPPEGEPLSLGAGERVRFERGQWKPLRGAATLAQLAELNDLSTPPLIEAKGAPRAPAAGQMPAGAIARRDERAATQQQGQVIGVATTPDEAPASKHPEGLLPRKSAVPHGQATVWPSQVAAPAEAPAPAPEPQQPQEPQFEDKASVWPSFGGGPTQYEPRVKVAPAPTHQAAGTPTPPDELPPVETYVPPAAPTPAPAPAAAAPAPKAAPKGEAPPTDLEAIFLQKAERGLEKGICERHLLGLQEIAADPSHNERSEKARMLRARCYDSRVRPDLSEIEYRRYLEVWPKGRFAEEARKALAE